MRNKNKPSAIKLSDIVELDATHTDGCVCSSKHLWNENGLKEEGEFGLPIRFRIVNNSIKSFSSSGIFTKSQLRNAFQKIKNENPFIKKIYNIDLIKEIHGFIKYSDNAVPFALRSANNAVNLDVPDNLVENDEDNIIRNLNQKFPEGVKIVSKFSTKEGALDQIYQTVRIKTRDGFMNEKKMMNSINDLDLNIEHIRIPCIDHRALSFQSIVSFTSFIQNTFNAETDWLHIHCHGGKGRSTSMSLIFDMLMRLQNADLNLNNISFQNLINFHKNSGGKDLTPVDSNCIWKKAMLEERYNKLESIYNLLKKIDDLNLKPIYSIALEVCLLHQHLDHDTLYQVVKKSSEVLQEAFNQNEEFFETQLMLLHSENHFLAEDGGILQEEDISNEIMICDLHSQNDIL